QNLSDLGGLIGISNSNLRSVKTRFEGVCLLALLVADSPTDTFQDQCISWLRTVQHTIQSQDPQTTIEVAIWALRDLLKYSAQLPELAREVAMNHIPTIVTSLLGLKPEVSPRLQHKQSPFFLIKGLRHETGSRVRFGSRESL
ncbi:hypothetical protein scyTo_0023986, partial [Scyliorhinus torazame]|nr:hypothetical protein [Scyliorhinus torazame]